MKTSTDIKNDLAKNGYSWLPNYKNILERIWANMETYFDENEEVKSALWASFKRFDSPKVGIVFITNKRTFTVEGDDIDGSHQIGYLPFDKYGIQKIQLQLAKTSAGMNYVSLQNDSFGNGITFATPNADVAKHFIDTLRGETDGEIEILPDSDDPLLAENEKPQLIDENLEKSKEKPPHVRQKKHKEEKEPMKAHDLWNRAPLSNKEKEVPIKIVPPKKVKPDKKIKTGYASKWKSKTWILWFLLPISFIGIVVAITVSINYISI
ncbi:hypothetical protein SHELI_v1c03260 [Spiroplasma helicoides]|uniref:Uncharacterized protein n=1 Tax=Spiroplasma helicoides TaxID=216938 RepID=A0A1B3SK26_9MOLU|nr:hypothetical protein [Spiroplasma helicoides]AOG60281.1 hypothetical protein SHELI_v1c03260 [Spiroplasma helicoides]